MHEIYNKIKLCLMTSGLSVAKKDCESSTIVLLRDLLLSSNYCLMHSAVLSKIKYIPLSNMTNPLEEKKAICELVLYKKFALYNVHMTS